MRTVTLYLENKMENNPWKDIASYQFDDAQAFKGRDDEISKFVRILQNGTASVLYAESGIGKSSLINAGIVPEMMVYGYYPVEIRCGALYDQLTLEVPSVLSQEGEDNDKKVRKLIEKKLIDSIGDFLFAPIKTKRIEFNKKYQLPDNGASSDSREQLEQVSRNDLWGLLHLFSLTVEWDVTDFDGNIVQQKRQMKPLLIFDQFEEVFVRAKKSSQGAVTLKALFGILEQLMSSSIPENIHAELKKLAEQDVYVDSIDCSHRFKVLFSLRKEYLSDFDHWTNDVCSIPELLQNRMFLLPMTREQATAVINEQPLPGDDTKNVETLSPVSDDIITLIDQGNNGGVEPFILSVLCSRLYEKAMRSGLPQLTSKDMPQSSASEILAEFYDNAVNGIFNANRQQLYTFESFMVDEDGHRNRVKVKQLGFSDDYLARLKEKHLVRTCDTSGGDEYIELIHDRIAEVIHGRAMLRRQHHKTNIIIAVIATIVVMMALGWFCYRTVMPRERVIEKPVSHETLTASEQYTIPSGVLTLNNTTVEAHAFAYNPDLRVLHIGDSVKLEADAFHDNNNLEEIYLDGKGIETECEFNECNSIRKIFISDTCSIDSIHWDCFRFYGPRNSSSRRYLSLLSIGQNPNMIQTNDGIKTSKSHLTVINFPDHGRLVEVEGRGKLKEEKYYTDTSSISINPPAEIGKEHYRYVSFTKLDSIKGRFPYRCHSVNLPKVTYIGNEAFRGDSIVSLYLPEVVLIGSKAFFDCKLLEDVDLPMVTTIGSYAFVNSQINFLSLPEATIINDSAFSACHNLQAIDLPKLHYLGDFSFYRCNRLQQVNLPELESVGVEAFFFSEKLCELDLPRVQFIGFGAFKDCYGLLSVNIPAVSEIGDGIFKGCSSLQQIRVSKKCAEDLQNNTQQYFDEKDSLVIKSQNDSTIVFNIIRRGQQLNQYYTINDDNECTIKSSVSDVTDKEVLNALWDARLKIERFSIPLGHEKVFSWRNALIECTHDAFEFKNMCTYYFAPNAEEVCILGRVYDRKVYDLEFCSKVILLDPQTSLYSIRGTKNPNGVEIKVPFGYKQFLGNLSFEGKYVITEMSFIETLYYKVDFMLAYAVNYTVCVLNQGWNMIGAVLFLLFFAYAFYIYVRKLKFGVPVSLMICLLWMLSYFLWFILIALNNHSRVDTFIASSIPIICCSLHLLFLAHRKRIYLIKRITLYSSLGIFVSCLLLHIYCKDVFNIESTLLYEILIACLIIACSELPKIGMFAITDADILVCAIDSCNLVYADQIRKLLQQSNLKVEQRVSVNEETIKLARTVKRCFLILSPELMRSQENRDAYIKIISKIQVFGIGMPLTFIVPIVYGTDNIANLFASERENIKRAIQFANAYVSPSIYMDILSEAESSQQIIKAANSNYSKEQHWQATKKGLKVGCWITLIAIVLLLLLLFF